MKVIYLTKDCASVMDSKFSLSNTDDNGTKAYRNSVTGRTQLETECPIDIVQAVESVWGTAPTVTELTPIQQSDPGPSATDLLGQQVATLTLGNAQKDTIISQLGAQMVQAQLEIASLKGGAVS